jgi:hypothetical protein
MDELLYREEMMWLQHSRVAWLKEGDHNMKFFHRKAVGRANKNKVKFLKKADGQFTKVKSEMEAMATSFFKELYTANPAVKPEEVLGLFEPTISDETNRKLCKEFSDEEIGDAMLQIGPLKAPGPDGFPAKFFQKHWEFPREDIIRGVKRFFTIGHLPPSVNEMAIVIIPKKKEPKGLKDFQPISLCNVIYKVVSKCMVNRLRPLL